MILGLAPSASEAKRLIEQGAERINDEKIDDIAAEITLGPLFIKIGRRKFTRLIQ